MELCESSLLEKYQLQYFTEEELKKVIRDICLGLNELHSKGIVHLDLKPGISSFFSYFRKHPPELEWELQVRRFGACQALEQAHLIAARRRLALLGARNA